MIRINNDRYRVEWQEGMTVARLIEVCRFTAPYLAVFVNGTLIDPKDYALHELLDGDQVKALHLVAGG